ncbi:aminoimidazole riboside kinase [Pantoea sp. 1.19]|uniref:aminoimidazole riboside kinase n=1 Tax=Pantoea sp. 1.19 TaxID=1925589 RepID=UPI0009491EB9|nr:aminoimidazole riboside kinase [Pantoea sp. 1.19]
MTAKVWVLGDAVVDLLPEGEGRLLKCPGGAPANVAVGIARLQGSSGFIGRVGDDPFGRWLQEVLAQEGVDTARMRRDAAQRTSTVVVDLDHEGERTFTFMVRPSADLFLTADDLPTFSAGEWLHACSIALSAEPSRSTALAAMRQIKAAGGSISFDPNIREDLWQDQQTLRDCLHEALTLADVVKLSEDELRFFAGDGALPACMAQLAERYRLRLLLVTQGKAGVHAWRGGALQHYPTLPVLSVDTTGAGDAFVSGLLWGLSREGMPESDAALAGILQVAQICGALATTAKGAMTALPHLAELQQQLA